MADLFEGSHEEGLRGISSDEQGTIRIVEQVRNTL